MQVDEKQGFWTPKRIGLAVVAQKCASLAITPIIIMNWNNIDVNAPVDQTNYS